MLNGSGEEGHVDDWIRYVGSLFDQMYRATPRTSRNSSSQFQNAPALIACVVTIGVFGCTETTESTTKRDTEIQTPAK